MIRPPQGLEYIKAEDMPRLEQVVDVLSGNFQSTPFGDPIYLFGSAMRTSDYKDIDLMVVMRKTARSSNYSKRILVRLSSLPEGVTLTDDTPDSTPVDLFTTSPFPNQGQRKVMYGNKPIERRFKLDFDGTLFHISTTKTPYPYAFEAEKYVRLA